MKRCYATDAKSRPILFSGPMVRAILDGKKTQTRRVCDCHPGVASFADAPMAKMRLPDEWTDTDREFFVGTFCPFGKVGDELWVRETFGISGLLGGMTPKEAAIYGRPSMWRYKASHPKWAHGWRPSIHMPRAASRITLEITDVRVQRLQDISEADARAEGITPDFPDEIECNSDRPFAEWFRWLWDSINAKRGFAWDSNPWVWAITFKRIDQ